MNECLTNVLIIQKSNFDERHGQLVRVALVFGWPQEEVTFYKIRVLIVRFLGNGISRKNAFEIYWPTQMVEYLIRRYSNFEIQYSTRSELRI